MKFLFIVLAFMFVGFAALQYNDPDPWRWMFIYGYMAVIMFLGYKNFSNKYLIYLAYLLALTGIIPYFPSFIDWIIIEKGQNLMERMDDSKMYIEETREFLGSIICVVSASLLWKISPKQ
jgi:hypothetical protein